MILKHYSESWLGLSRPSTPCLLSCRKKDVDARDKRGHDAGEMIRSDTERALGLNLGHENSV